MTTSVTAQDCTLSCGVRVRKYRSIDAAPCTIVFAHGGGFSWGTLDDYDQIARNLCATTTADLVSVDYRLAPQYPFPAGLDDVCAVLQEISATAGPGHAVVIAGDSAGACLAAGAAQRMVAERVTGVAAQLLIYPMIQYHDRTPPAFHTLADKFHPSFEAVRNAWEAYLQGPVDKAGRYAVPPCGELDGLPPALTIVAENDPLRFEAMEYAEQLKAAGVDSRLADYKETVHGFMNEPAVGVAYRALLDTRHWLAHWACLVR